MNPAHDSTHHTLPVIGPGAGRPRGTSPFADVVPTLWLAAGYALAVVTWLAAGPALPGDRWLAVHLFTLGVLTNLILAFSEHFSRAVTRTPGDRAWWWTWLANAGIVLLLIGLPTGWLPGLAAGATLLTTVVGLAGWRLRTMRRGAVGARLTWVVRLYERAHVAFVYAAFLGALLGLGMITGPWYLGARLAHLHANVLGWAGITLLATLVFFGPTMARSRIEPGADEAAARALRRGAAALLVAVVLLLLLGLPGGWGTAARVAAGLGLTGFATATTAVSLPVWRAVLRAGATASRPLLLGALVWLVAVVWLDALVVATGAWRWLDAIGVAALAGVLAPAILSTLVYLAPMLRGRSTGERELVRVRLEVGARTRAALLNLAVAAITLGAARLTGDLPAARLGWCLLSATVIATIATGLWPLGTPRAEPG
jgi:nitrite reductase (NO-forming)